MCASMCASAGEPCVHLQRGYEQDVASPRRAWTHDATSYLGTRGRGIHLKDEYGTYTRKHLKDKYVSYTRIHVKDKYGK